MDLASRTGPGWAKALSISLLLHAVGLAVFYFAFSAPLPLSGAGPAPSYLEVEFAPRPPRPSAPPVSAITAPLEQAVIETAPDEQPPDGGGMPPGPEEADPPSQDLAEGQPAQEPAAAPGGEPAVDGQPGSSPPPAVTALSISQDIASFASSYRRDLNQDWVEACLRYRNESGKRDCPGDENASGELHQEERNEIASLFAAVNRPAIQRRLSNQMLDRYAALAPLMNEEGEAGRLARDRYYLNKQYWEYLNGNFDYKISSFVQISQINPHSGRPKTFFQVICNPQPCVWEYTGFRVVPPQDESADNGVEFKPMAPLFRGD